MILLLSSVMPRRFTFLFFCALWVGGWPVLRADLTSPVLVQSVPTQSVGRSGGTQTVNLHTYLQDPNVPGTAVRMTTQVGTLGVGNIDIALYDTQTPITVANFLAYINAGRYANNIVHRSDPGSVPSGQQGFVIQGGGFAFGPAPGGGLQINQVPTFSMIQNEPGISNLRGTIAMAKTSDPNSATSQWFINLSDSNTFLDSPVNGAFTVFGKVIGNGMAVADIISGLRSNWGYSAPFNQLPLTANVTSDTGNFVITNTAVVPSVTYTANSSNTSLVTTGISGNTLTLTSVGTNTGNANITVTATDLEGGTLQTTFGVSVLDTYSVWKTGISFGNATLAAETADPDHDGVKNLAEYAFGGDPLHARPLAPGVPVPETGTGGGVTFYVRQVAALSYEVDESPDLATWTKVWQTSDGFSNSSIVVARTVLSGFDQITIRNPSPPPGNRHFWRVIVTRSL